MFAITASPTWFAKTDDFKKIGKKIQKQRKTEVDKIKDKIGDIARDERKRVQEMFKEHQDIIDEEDEIINDEDDDDEDEDYKRKITIINDDDNEVDVEDEEDDEEDDVYFFVFYTD